MEHGTGYLVRFPAGFLTAAALQQQGTGVHSFKLLWSGQVTGVGLIGLALTLGLPAAQLAVVRHCTRGGFVPGAHDLRFMAYRGVVSRVPWLRRWTADPNSVRAALWRWIGPVGAWTPTPATRMFGGLVRHIRPVWVSLSAARGLQVLGFSAVAAMPVQPGWLCSMQFAVLAVVTVVVPVASSVMQPFRVRILAPLQCVAACATAIVLCVFALAASTAASDEPVSAVQLRLISAGSFLVLSCAVLQTLVLAFVTLVEVIYLGSAEDPFVEVELSAM